VQQRLWERSQLDVRARCLSWQGADSASWGNRNETHAGLRAGEGKNNEGDGGPGCGRREACHGSGEARPSRWSRGAAVGPYSEARGARPVQRRPVEGLREPPARGLERGGTRAPTAEATVAGSGHRRGRGKCDANSTPRKRRFSGREPELTRNRAWRRRAPPERCPSTKIKMLDVIQHGPTAAKAPSGGVCGQTRPLRGGGLGPDIGSTTVSTAEPPLPERISSSQMPGAWSSWCSKGTVRRHQPITDRTRRLQYDRFPLSKY